MAANLRQQVLAQVVAEAEGIIRRNSLMTPTTTRPYARTPSELVNIHPVQSGIPPLDHQSGAHSAHDFSGSECSNSISDIYDLYAQLECEPASPRITSPNFLRLRAINDSQPRSATFPLCSPRPPTRANSVVKTEETSAEEAFYGATSLLYLAHHAVGLEATVTVDDRWPVAGGGNANIWRGKVFLPNGSKIRVAIKVLRETETATTDVIARRLRREARVWSKLKHRNVLPFIGVCYDLMPARGMPRPALIAPFCKSGNVINFLRKHSDIDYFDRSQIVLGVASGLQYLHAHRVVHGDLTCSNILIDKQGVPSICDFGISKILDSPGFTTRPSGTPQYMAPELFSVFYEDGRAVYGAATATYESDVYAFGLVALQILTSMSLKNRPAQYFIPGMAVELLRPQYSDYVGLPFLPKPVWNTLDLCWAPLPEMRPEISDVRERFQFVTCPV
uniref:TKL/TKL-ccin protein kinase n=1 Tax=Mycena chlorophos TaxID=658473 RepID=A0ABQ0LHV0_MYCCL|nr:TKL/TKL-ccin protein kinase [Mycena chlorophos]